MADIMNLEEIRYALKYYNLPAESIYNDSLMADLESEAAVWRMGWLREQAIKNISRASREKIEPTLFSIKQAFAVLSALANKTPR